MSHLIAAIDESMRTRNYLLCATVVSTADRPHVRQTLRTLLLPGQRRIHATSESEGRKRTLLKSLADVRGIACHIAIGRSRREGGREQCLRALAHSLHCLGVREIVLERVDPGTARRDHEVLSSLFPTAEPEISWSHKAASEDSILWISDLVAFAYNASGSLRQAAGPLISTVAELHK